MDVKKVVLYTVAAAGLLTMMAIAPNAIQALPKLGLLPSRYNRRRYIQSVVGRLTERGLVEFVTNRQGIRCARLTARGREELKKYKLKELKLLKPRRWDGKYRLIMFDIKEWRRGVRDELRQWLEHLGFVRLQNSVWVYPFECREVIILLKSYFHIGNEVLYVTAEKIENDKWLRREFNLDQ